MTSWRTVRETDLTASDHAALATLLGLTPVLVHRLHFQKRMKQEIVRLANVLLIATLVVVSVIPVACAVVGLYDAVTGISR